MRKKVALVGAGATGMMTACLLAQEEIGDLVLLDLPQTERATKGKSLDLSQAGPIAGFSGDIQGGSDPKLLRGADVVVVTAGVPRKPGMSRDDLVTINQKIVHEIGRSIARWAPQSVVLVLSNPVDAMTYVMAKATGFSARRVLGQSGVLDAARFCYFVAQELGVDRRDVSGLVLGGHGDTMVPLVRYATVGGVPLTQLLPDAKLAEIVERTRKGGGEIVSYLQTGSAYHAPAAALAAMTLAILRDTKRVLPAVAFLQGEYGYKDIYLGVPVILGAAGVEKVLVLTLDPSEEEALRASAKSVHNVMGVLESLREQA